MPAWGAEVPVVPWLAHSRLLRALSGSSTAGSLTKNSFDGALEAALNPPPGVLEVLDPRPYTAQAVHLMVSERIPLLPAVMLATAIQHGAGIHVFVKNFVDRWEDIVEGTGASIRVYETAELRSGR